jgi:hypothetical protein
MGRPSFTGDYQKELAEEHKLRKPEYQQKDKELSEAPTSTLKTESALQAHRKLMQKATVFAQELARHDVHHIIMMVPQSVALASKMLSSVGFGEIFYKILTTKGVNGQDFHSFCRGNELKAELEKAADVKEFTRDAPRKRVTAFCRRNELQAELQKAADVKEFTRDALRKRVTALLLDKLSKLMMTEDHISSECLTLSRCFPNWSSPCPVSTGETRRRACFTQLEVGGTGGLRSIAGRDHRQVAELRSEPSGGGLQSVARRRVEARTIRDKPYKVGFMLSGFGGVPGTKMRTMTFRRIDKQLEGRNITAVPRRGARGVQTSARNVDNLGVDFAGQQGDLQMMADFHQPEADITVLTIPLDNKRPAAATRKSRAENWVETERILTETLYENGRRRQCMCGRARDRKRVRFISLESYVAREACAGLAGFSVQPRVARRATCSRRRGLEDHFASLR